MIRVVVVDDEPMVCAHLRVILGSVSDIEVVAEAHDGAEGVEAVVRHRPDLVLMDLRMPGVDGLPAIERIAALPAPPPVVVPGRHGPAGRFLLGGTTARHGRQGPTP